MRGVQCSRILGQVGQKFESLGGGLDRRLLSLTMPPVLLATARRGNRMIVSPEHDATSFASLLLRQSPWGLPLSAAIAVTGRRTRSIIIVQTFPTILGPTIFDRDVLFFDKPALVQPSVKGSHNPAGGHFLTVHTPARSPEPRAAARAPSGQATAAPPKNVMNDKRQCERPFA